MDFIFLGKRKMVWKILHLCQFETAFKLLKREYRKKSDQRRLKNTFKSERGSELLSPAGIDIADGQFNVFFCVCAHYVF